MDEGGGLKHVMVMVGLQCIYAGIAIFSKEAFLQGMKPPIFVAYRQVITALIIVPPALYNRRRNSLSLCLGWKISGLTFAAAFLGIAVNQNAYFEGLNLSSATVATAMVNLLPVLIFVMATALGLEKFNFRSMRSMAKVLGTVVCVGGAVSMALIKGPELLQSKGEYMQTRTLLQGLQIQNWLLGCLILFGGCCCWSSWLMLQVPISANCPDDLYTTAWTCFFGMLQSAALALVLEREWEVWRINTVLEYGACLFAGVGAAFAFFGQAWCVSRRGPVFTAMFNPLNTVLAIIFAYIFLHEALSVGSLLGAGAVIVGLYIVLWGKAKDQKDTKHEQEEVPAGISTCDDIPIQSNNDHQVLADGSPKKTTEKNPAMHLQEPLLSLHRHNTSNPEEP
ncbi:WAT1-related protein At4g30420-like [Punica granatum]|uniref:WAT1-related protein n=1 Tax=Punica granatum TaxID=22663 RepID=A0A6P8D9S2_PUNGR|nr:WAT1-related protein At4g30420-like [Punica granatum]